MIQLLCSVKEENNMRKETLVVQLSIGQKLLNWLMPRDNRLSCLSDYDTGVEKDMEKEIYHLEEATIGGHPVASHQLGLHEWNNNGNTERAVKNYIIAATQGYDDTIKMLMDAFNGSLVSKNDLSSALSAHQAAVDATKSPQRDFAEDVLKGVGSVD